MVTEILEKLFGSAAKVKILKLFLFNQDRNFDIVEISSRTKVTRTNARTELVLLQEIGLLRSKTAPRKRRSSGKKILSRKNQTWSVERKFPYLEALENFLSNINPFKHQEILKKISKAGRSMYKKSSF